MEAGRLNQRITIEQLEQVKKASGQVVGEWKTLCTVWAQVECTDSKTIDGDGYTQHEGLYRFYIRWRRGLTANMRVKWNNRIFTLVGPPADWKTERTGLTLITKELI